MLFATLRTRPVRQRALNEAARSGRRNDPDAGRCRVRRHPGVGAFSGSSALDGWKTGAAHSQERDKPEAREPVEIANLFDAVQQIVRLRAMLREKQSEVDVLAEALDYARSVCPEN